MANPIPTKANQTPARAGQTRTTTSDSPTGGGASSSGKLKTAADPASTEETLAKVFAESKESGTQENPLDGPVEPAGDADAVAAADETEPLGSVEDKAIAIRKGKSRIKPLSKKEMDDLENCEAVIEEGLPKFLAVGEALYLIMRNKLYRMQYKTFAEYCEKRFGLSRANAYLQMGAAQVSENLSTNGLQIPATITERVLRPLASQTLEVQLAAWELALKKANGAKITGKMVEEAIQEVLAEEDQQQEDWFTRCRDRLVAAGYGTDFNQPVNVGEDEWIDVLDEANQTYVKLIDKPSLSSFGVCLAMREAEVKYQVVVNGNDIPKGKRAMVKGELTRLLDPLLSFFIDMLGAYVEYDGTLYQPAQLDNHSKLEMKRAEGADAEGLIQALEEVQG